MTQLGLGTVQFGMSYGISNQRGQTSRDEVAAILELAAGSRIRVLDTAALYGDSESALGAALASTHPFRIVTKTPEFGAEVDPAQCAIKLEQAFERSLASLRQQKLYGLLVHKADDLFGPRGDAIWKSMQELRKRGLVEKIGVSVYTAEQIDLVLAHFDPTLIQVPVNIVDQRLIHSGHLAKLKGRNIEIHARSVFLQGVLLMRPEDMPNYFHQFGPELSNYTGFLARHGLSPLEGALSFLRDLEEVDVALVGVTCRAELQGCLDAFRAAQKTKADFSAVACRNERLLNPALWPRN